MERHSKHSWESFVVEPERVLGKLKPGMSIFIGSGVAEPRTMMRHLMASAARKLDDIEIIQLLSLGDAISPQALSAKAFRLKTFYSGWMAEAAISEGQVDFIPFFTSEAMIYYPASEFNDGFFFQPFFI
mgnify:CR=1 FL=1